MRTLARFLSLLLCLELIVSPIAPNMSLIAQNAHAETCPTGFTFDSVLNRCLTKTETANVMNATMSCGNDVACYKANAQQAFQAEVNKGTDGVGERKKDGFVSKIATIAAIAGPVTYASIGLSTSTAQCLSPSFYAMVAGALALVVGDNLANMQHKKRLKKIKEDWGKIVNPEQAKGDKDKERETSIEAQSEAFEMLAQAEDSLVKAAKMKEKFFYVATLAYGAATVMALMEKAKSTAVKVAATTAITTGNGTAAAAAVVNPSASAINAALQTLDTSMTATKTALETKTAQAAATPAPSPTAVATAASASGMALKSKAEAAALVAKATARLSAAQAALVTANALVPANAATVSLAAADVASAQAILTAANAMLQDANTSLCNSMGVSASVPSAKPTSLYSYFSSGERRDIRQEIQSLYNLEHSTDMASFVMNEKELNGQITSIEDYNEHQKEFEEIESIDKSIFESFKATSLSIIRSMNPIASAYANEQEQLTAVDDVSGSGSASASSNTATASGTNSATSTSTSAGVNTNAAKAFKEDEGKGIDLLTIGLGVGVGYLLLVKTGIQEKLITPTGRAIFSGVMGGLSLLMAKHAGSQAEASEKRAELLRKMKAEFASASGAIYACKSEDRNDPGKPNCYCYTADNQRNSSRGNSQICQKLWAGVNTNVSKLASTASSSRVCVTQNRQADATCACRSTNTCMKVSLNGVKGLDMGSMSVLGNGINPLNKVMNGSIDAANLDAASLSSQAAKMADLAKKIENTKGMADYKKNKAALETKLKNELTRGAASLPSGSMVGGAGGDNMPSNAGDAARMLEKELENAAVPTVAGGGSNDFIAAPVPEPALEFGMTGDQLAEQEGQIAEVMKQDLDYGGNDINQGSKTNIFDVLSNRYQRSGMRRLFDEKGETKPEAAAKTDITE